LHTLPSVPCTIRTRLQLDLLLQEPSIDLAAVAEIILSDPGATLQVYRLIGEEFSVDEERPTRIEDCIASLNRESWYRAVCQCLLTQQSGLIDAWERMREVARCAKALAQCVDGFAPEEAYVVGMFYGLGQLPGLLGWKLGRDWPREEHTRGLRLATAWNLPPYLVNALGEQQGSAVGSRWGILVHFARSIAEKRRNGAF
jgi:hypothetical protein